MTGKELFLKILLSLNTYLEFDDQDLIDMIETDEDLDEACDRFNILNPPAQFFSFIESLKKISFANKDSFISTPYSITGDTYIIDFNQLKFEKKNRRFAYSDVEFGFVSTKALFDNGVLVDLSDEKNSLIWKQLEEYLERNYTNGNIQNIEIFFDVLASFDLQKGIVINKTIIPFNEDQHYPYIYLSFLNESNSILLTQHLKYKPTTLSNSLTYDITKNYEQYFDIYDVINELNQAPDILNRFLRLYHTMEYFVYRVYLVDLVSRVGTNKLFIREFIIASETMKRGEKETFIKNFVKIFGSDLIPTIHHLLNPIATSHVVTFLKDQNIVSGFATNDIKKIAELIYSLRCCIVHNKEGEYHITISNYDEYEVIIPLIRKILEVFEKLVIDKISQNHTAINYTQQSINIY